MSKEPEPGAHRHGARRVIDWDRAAALLTRGLTIAQAAEHVGCSRSTLAHKCRHDPAFQARLERCRDAEPNAEAVELAELQSTAHGAIEAAVRAGSVRVVLWLAERLKLVTPPSERTPQEELRAILQALTPEELREFEALRNEP